MLRDLAPPNLMSLVLIGKRRVVLIAGTSAGRMEQRLRIDSARQTIWFLVPFEESK
jgi:hypothetical protein